VGLLLYRVPWVGWIFIAGISAMEFLILLGSKNGRRLGDEFAKTAVIELVKSKGGQEV
jgi:uncharacterized RDD family membrane protein YckC